MRCSGSGTAKTNGRAGSAATQRRPPPAARARTDRAIGRGRDIEDQRRFVERAHEDRDAVERTARGHDTRGTDDTVRGLDADRSGKTRRNAARTGGIRSERKADESARDGDRRTRTRPARNVGRIEWIGGHAVGRTRADQAGRELVEIRLAQDDGAGSFKALDDGRRARRGIGECRAARRGGQARDIDVVLDGKRHTEQRQRRARRRAERIERPRAFAQRASETAAIQTGSRRSIAA